ncbi:glycosyltransferase family 2 protein [Dyella ginsengisoli]|uniref:Glycosyltransferase family 2 protein n=1 Tax=Dyella ginsengisoli TaxID=363848 RepID=A0ABW8JUL3_9GAMM
MINSTISERVEPPALSVIIPCYNEESVISDTVRNLSVALRKAGISHEIICVNNASSDRTEEVLSELAGEIPDVLYITTPPIPGYGVAVRWGLDFFSGSAVVIVMADGSEDPDDVVAFFRKIEDGYDCAFGNRFETGVSVVGYPLFKRLLNRLGNALIASITKADYGDFTNGFKCYRRHVVDSMRPLCSDQFNLTVEMSINAVLSGARFAVVSNSWKDRDAGVSKFGVLKQSKLYLMTIAYCWLRARLRGKSWKDFQEQLASEKKLRGLGTKCGPAEDL